jgi:hypothetical protein
VEIGHRAGKPTAHWRRACFFVVSLLAYHHLIFPFSRLTQLSTC